MDDARPRAVLGLVIGKLGELEEGKIVIDSEISLINDIRGNLTDAELMEKYQLSAAELRRRLLQLLNTNAVSSADVYWRPLLYDYEVSDDDRRERPRYPLELLLPVNQAGSQESVSGFLVDINEKGGCVKGINPSLGKKVTLRIEPGTLVSAAEIIVDVAFRWVERVGEADFLAGFQIVAISDRDSALLSELIRTIVHTP
jgi:PilZ domain